MRSNDREHARFSNGDADLEPDSRTYSEGIRIEQEGPVRNFTCTSVLEYGEAPRNYREGVGLALRMVPHEYCSTLIVDDRLDVDSQPVRHSQEIRFKPKWIVCHFEDTVYNYPKEVLKRYVSTLTYDSDSRPRTFVSGLSVCMPVNSADLGQLLSPTPGPESWEADEVFQNGTRETLQQRKLYESSKVKMEFDENANWFCATKDVTVNGI